MIPKPIATGIVFSSIFFATASAQAQVSVDVSTITCDQVGHNVQPLNLAAWLSGYYHAKRNNRILDPQALEENTNKVQNYCSDEKNSKVAVMKAVEQVLGGPSAQAQISVDVSKITCDQYVHAKIKTPSEGPSLVDRANRQQQLIAAWLSGYYNAKRNNTTIDLLTFDDNVSKVQNYCYYEKNFKVPVMKAVEQVLGGGASGNPKQRRPRSGR
jgi:acid stress chaperone HdeB